MNTLLKLFILISVIGNFTCAQQTTKEFPKLTGPYLGQTPPGDTSIVFAKGIVSTEHHEHSRITFSKNGAALYWSVIPIDSNKVKKGERPYMTDSQKIFYSKTIKNEWIKPAVLEYASEISGKSGVSSPAFSANGNTFFFQIRKPSTERGMRPMQVEIWKANYSDGSLGKPEREYNLIPNQENKTCMSFCFSNNGNLYFDYGGPDEKGEWLWNIYFSKFVEGVYSPPVKMSSSINDEKINWCPWIAPDESYLIFSSHRKGNFGDGDLYISFNIDNLWTKPINMGPKVNTLAQERFPSVSPDGKYLFFARHLPETFNDIFWVDAKIIEDLKNKRNK